MSHLLRLFGAVAATAVVAGVLTGCSILGERFDPQGRKAAAARATASQAVERRLDDLLVGLNEHGRLRGDACQQGQDNWKRVDEYAWDCRVGIAAVLDGASTADGVAPALVSLHDRLEGLGCRPRDGAGLLDVERDYWRALRDRPGYGPDDLPMQVYECADGVLVEVRSTSPAASDLDSTLQDPFGIGFAGDTRISAQGLPPEAVQAARSSMALQLFIVRVTRPYYTIPS